MRYYLSVYLMLLSMYIIPAHSESHHPQEFLKSISGTKDEGAQIYTHFCVNCHAEKPVIPLGAPRFGVQEDWKSRLKQGFDVLFLHTDEGLNAMPPRGGCFECTDRQLALTIISMLPKESQKSLLNDLGAHKNYK